MRAHRQICIIQPKQTVGKSRIRMQRKSVVQKDNLVRGHFQIDVQSCHSRLISPEIFKQLGSYESPKYALSNEVWELYLL